MIILLYNTFKLLRINFGVFKYYLFIPFSILCVNSTQQNLLLMDRKMKFFVYHTCNTVILTFSTKIIVKIIYVFIITIKYCNK